MSRKAFWANPFKKFPSDIKAELEFLSSVQCTDKSVAERCFAGAYITYYYIQTPT